MEKYIVSKDFILWSERKRTLIMNCITAINKHLNSNESDINKIELTKQSIKKCNAEYAEIAAPLRGKTDNGISWLPIKYSEEQCPELIALFQKILEV